MSQLFWQHKLRSLLTYPKHPIWQTDCISTEMDQNHFWQQLQCMENFSNTEPAQPSPRTQSELELIDFWFAPNDSAELCQASSLTATNPPRSPTPTFHSLPETILNCPEAQKVFWWFWRCYPDSNPQMRSQPVSTWSDCSVSAALAGSQLGYPGPHSSLSHNHDLQEHRGHGRNRPQSQPFLALFSLAPVLEFLQASRTVQDIGTGAWILNYLTSKICWKLAWKYGPDIFLQPCLYAQPWIDFWLLQHYPDFEPWLARSSKIDRLNAHFPNTLMLIVPDNGIDTTIAKGNPIWASMIYAEQILKQEWLTLGEQVLADLAEHHAAWQRIDSRFWEGWLEPYWQPSWLAMPINNINTASTANTDSSPQKYISDFNGAKSGFLQQAQQNLHNVQDSRSWKLPTIFSMRSSLSGVGAVVHPICDPQHPEGASTAQIQDFWRNQVSSPCFDATEALNAVEVLKRGLPQILPQLLEEDPIELQTSIDRQPVFNTFNSTSIATPVTNPWLVLAASQSDVDYTSDTVEAELMGLAALKRLLLTFSHQLAPEITSRHQGNLLYACDADVLAEVAFPTWDQWLWQMYESWEQMWHAEGQTLQIHPNDIHFGLVIASAAIPLSFVLEQVWQAKSAAAQYSRSIASPFKEQTSPVVQVRLLEGEGSILTATAQFTAFNQWRSVVRQWQQEQSGLKPHDLEQFFQILQQTTPPEVYDREAQNWLQLAVFHLR